MSHIHLWGPTFPRKCRVCDERSRIDADAWALYDVAVRLMRFDRDGALALLVERMEAWPRPVTDSLANVTPFAQPDKAGR